MGKEVVLSGKVESGSGSGSWWKGRIRERKWLSVERQSQGAEVALGKKAESGSGSGSWLWQKRLEAAHSLLGRQGDRDGIGSGPRL